MKIKLRIGRKLLLIMKANPRYAGWYFERGPFGCWNAYLGPLRIGWELARWH